MMLQIIQFIECVNGTKITKQIKRNMVHYYVLKNTLFLKLVPEKYLCGDKKRRLMSYYVERVQPD
jgi:hypothetical protein